MRFGLSCTATSELLQCTIYLYVHFNDEAFRKS
jgi:hypothetical protein